MQQIVMAYVCSELPICSTLFYFVYILCPIKAGNEFCVD